MATINMNNGTQLTATFSSMENGVISFTGGSGFSTMAPVPTGVIVVSDSAVNIPFGYIRKIA